MSKIKVFLDRNIISESVIIEPSPKTETIRWGDRNFESTVSGYRRKPLYNNWKDEEVACLPTIARLANENHIELFEAQEVNFEGWSAVIGARGTKGDIFRDTIINRVSDAVDRSYLASQTIEQVTSRDQVISFCRLLQKITPETLQNHPKLWDRFPKFMQDNIRNIDRFHSLLGALPYERHLPDALHLWSSETYSADYFLTIDQKFINALTKTAKIHLPTIPLRPTELLQMLAISELDPLPITEFGFLSFMEMH